MVVVELVNGWVIAMDEALLSEDFLPYRMRKHIASFAQSVAIYHIRVRDL